ncbi:MAG: PAS domain S-box protein [Candidatus Aegiribacteria sp.]|nr:PAS domain S-box protein [Candidatus Aegiribacteria sp.]
MNRKAPYRGIFEASNDAFLIYDLKGVVKEANPAACEMHSYLYEEMIGLSGKDFVHPDYQYLFKQFVEEIPSGIPLADELVEIRKDGSTFNIEVRGNVFEYEDEPHILAIIRDITVRKWAEEALRENEKKFRLLAENSIDCIWMLDTRMRFTYLSPSVETILGYRPEQLVGTKMSSHFKKKEFFKVGALAAKAIKNYKTFTHTTFETRMLNSKNKEVDLEITGKTLFNDQGKLIGLQGTTRDITERRKSEEVLRESEEQLQALINAMPGFICFKDGEGRWLKANDAAIRIFQLEGIDYRGKKDSELAELSSRLKGAFLTCKESDAIAWNEGSPIHVEEIISQPDGTVRAYDVSKVPVFHPDGGRKGVVVMGHDITERKKSEEEIRKLSRIVETTPEAIVVTDMQGKIEYVNQGLLTLGGFEDDSSLIGRYVFSFSDEEGARQLLKEEIIPTIVSERKWIGEITVKRRDGSMFPTEMVCSFIPDEEGKPKYLLSQFLDITRRKNTEEKLRESEQKFRDMTNLLPQIVYEIDIDGNLTFVNEQAFDSFGYSQEEYEKGINVLHTLIPSDRNTAKKNIQNVLYGRDVGNPEYTALRKDGSTFPILIYSSAILKDNKPAGLRGIIIDITERKQAEEEKARIEDQYRQAQKMESVGRLAGGVAHDFNNMLGVILGYTEMSLDKINPAQPVYAALQEIRKAADRSADLTRQLLAFARRQTVSTRVLDLNETAEGMLKMLHRLIGEDIDLAWLPCADLWSVNVDPSQIDQILANLCVNSQDAIEGVGKMTIETGNVAFDNSYCREHPGSIPGEYVLLAVSDDGCGMDKETLDNLFEPFFTTKEVGQGTGLGLATVYGIVKQNNGFIYVYSEPGEGTTFRIYLPRHAGKAAQIQKKDPAEPVRRGHETILLVEDEPAILKMATTMLERQGYTVLAATLPGEAIRLAGEYEKGINLLMTDVVMPEMNGRDLAENILLFYPDIKRLFMSGYTANVIAHRRVLDEGVNFIQKPFSMQDLATKVREVLDSE